MARPAVALGAKLHIGLNGESGEIVVIGVSSNESDDSARTGALLDEITHPIASLTADGGCDQARVYEAVDECQPDPGYRGAAFDGGLGWVRRDRSETARPINPKRSLSASRMGWQNSRG